MISQDIQKPVQYKIKACYTEDTVRVYQSFSPELGAEVLILRQFSKKFPLDRMLWFKVSFLGSMYDCTWGKKPGRTKVIAFDIKREAFNYLLKNGLLSTYDEDIHLNHNNWKKMLDKTEICINWEADRNLFGNALSRKTVEIGVRYAVLEKCIQEWIVGITDITNSIVCIKSSLEQYSFSEKDLPKETDYPLV
ncbi:hypothetical protein FACS189418_6350 [Clostridia bacterium]|nr:hypothetical protein FACS189418_6350 [Clostridia bacterium]